VSDEPEDITAAREVVRHYEAAKYERERAQRRAEGEVLLSALIGQRFAIRIEAVEPWGDDSYIVEFTARLLSVEDWSAQFPGQINGRMHWDNGVTTTGIELARSDIIPESVADLNLISEVLADAGDARLLTKPQQYVEQSRAAAAEIATWPGWMQRNLEPRILPATEDAMPERIVVGKNGAYWRDFGTHYSMCPVSTDNDPIEPFAVYVRATPEGTFPESVQIRGHIEGHTLVLDEPIDVKARTTVVIRSSGTVDLDGDPA